MGIFLKTYRFRSRKGAPDKIHRTFFCQTFYKSRDSGTRIYNRVKK